jgi:hypothetical protein
MAMVGFGRYAGKEYVLGTQEDVRIPRTIRLFTADFLSKEKNTIEATLLPPAHGDLRIVMQQRSPDGAITRSWKGGPPNGTNMGKWFMLRASQNGKEIPVEINYDKVIWSGLSWAVGEIKSSEIAPGQPITIRCSSAEKDEVKLDGKIYEIQY